MRVLREVRVHSRAIGRIESSRMSMQFIQRNANCMKSTPCSPMSRRPSAALLAPNCTMRWMPGCEKVWLSLYLLQQLAEHQYESASTASRVSAGSHATSHRSGSRRAQRERGRTVTRSFMPARGGCGVPDG